MPSGHSLGKIIVQTFALMKMKYDENHNVVPALGFLSYPPE